MDFGSHGVLLQIPRAIIDMLRPGIFTVHNWKSLDIGLKLEYQYDQQMKKGKDLTYLTHCLAWYGLIASYTFPDPGQGKNLQPLTWN